MGIALSRSEDAELYRDAYEEAQRIIRISDEVRMSLEKVEKASDQVEREPAQDEVEKLSTSRLGKKLNLSTQELLTKLTETGLLEIRDDKHYLTDQGKQAGGEFKMSKRFGPYFIWPTSMTV
jgi:DNA-binding transcriptional MerR regulator